MSSPQIFGLMLMDVVVHTNELLVSNIHLISVQKCIHSTQHLPEIFPLKKNPQTQLQRDTGGVFAGVLSRMLKWLWKPAYPPLLLILLPVQGGFYQHHLLGKDWSQMGQTLSLGVTSRVTACCCASLNSTTPGRTIPKESRNLHNEHRVL